MSFIVTVQPSGRSFQVDRDEAILSAAIREGVGLPYGCKDGACSSCKCRLLEGRVIHGVHQSKALSPQEEAEGFVLTCCATPQSDVTIEARTVPGAGEFPVRKMPSRVRSIEFTATDVAVIQLQLPATDPLRYRAGQYIEFILNDGSRRSYSMASPPAGSQEASPEEGAAPAPPATPPGIELHIRHMPGGKFTDRVFGGLKEKDILRLEGPFGSFFLREDSTKPIVMLASGTGFAPIKAMLAHMRRAGIDRPTTLYWGCRSKADLYQHEWCLEAAAGMPWLSYVPVLSEPKREDYWMGRTGFVHQAVMADHPNLAGHQVYACGAPVMVESAQHDFEALCGLPSDEFYADAFTSERDKHAND